MAPLLLLVTLMDAMSWTGYTKGVTMAECPFCDAPATSTAPARSTAAPAADAAPAFDERTVLQALHDELMTITTEEAAPCAPAPAAAPARQRALAHSADARCSAVTSAAGAGEPRAARSS